MRNIGSQIILFLLNPFLSGINSLVNIKEKHALTFLYLWFIIFGIGFVAQNEAADSYRWVEKFYENHNMSWWQYVLEVKEYFTFDSNTKDLYQLTVNYIVGSFTDNYHWTYFIYAIVFGFFYIKSLKYLVPYITKTPSSYILLFLFCFSNPIFNINGMRFWTASWIGVYVLFKIVIDKKFQYYLLLAITPLIHGSFFVWIVFFIVAQIVPKIRNLWIVLYILSLFLSLGSELTRVSDLVFYLPTFMQNMFKHYTTNEELLAIYDMEALPLYARVLKTLPRIMIAVLTLIPVFALKSTNKKDRFTYLINYYLVLTTLVNFATAIPTMRRFTALTIPPLVLIWAHFNTELKNYKRFLNLTPFAYSYSILYWFRHMLSVTELYLYVLPAPATIIKYLFLS